MASLIIMRPLLVAAYNGTGTNPELALTPTPKEAWSIAAASTAYIDLDLGSAQSVDSFFVGYHNAAAASPTWKVEARSSLGGSVTSTPVPTMPLLIDGADTPQHSFWRASSPSASVPVSSRYWRFTITNPSGQPTLTIPVVALGLGFQPFHGREYGSGRPVGDTGTSERLFGGDFADEEGATFGGFVWTMGDLLDDEVETLYAILRRIGTSRTVLVCEDPDQTTGLNERLHWGKLSKVDAFERAAVGATRWSLRVDDWA